MTRDQYVEICSRCLNRKFDAEQGVICSLSNKVADFQQECGEYKLDSNALTKTPVYERIPTQEEVGRLPSDALEKMRAQQDLGFAVIGGFAAAVVGAIFWAAVTVATNYQIGYMAVVVGLLVGFSVRYFGSGIDQVYGVVGALLALLGCAMGNLFSQLAFAAHDQLLGYYEVLTYVNIELISAIFSETFEPMDVLFYGIAAYEGYKFSFRKFTEQEIALANEGKVVVPSFNKFRLPIVTVLFLGLSAFAFILRNGYTGEKIFYYESGEMSAKGIMEGGKPSGIWETYWDGGKLQSKGNYIAGRPDGAWEYYDAGGTLIRKAAFRRGLQHGEAIHYHPDGKVKEQGHFVDNREEGPWKVYDEEGRLLQSGAMKMGRFEGMWEYFYPDGKTQSKGAFTNGLNIGRWQLWNEKGIKTFEYEYDEEGNDKVIFVADDKGVVYVADGNGEFKTFYQNGKQRVSGKVSNGSRVGKWLQYFDNGKVREEGEYRQGKYFIMNTWNAAGQPQVNGGTGAYKSYYDDGSVMETGTLEDGLRAGSWKVFYPGTENVMREDSYVTGLADGPCTYYNNIGTVYYQGYMKEGKRHGEWSWFFEGGAIESTVNFVQGKKEGIQQTFDVDGNLLVTEEYKNGERISLTIPE